MAFMGLGSFNHLKNLIVGYQSFTNDLVGRLKSRSGAGATLANAKGFHSCLLVATYPA
jgi:hypothetical protein